MDYKQAVQSYREATSKLRLKLSQLEIGSIDKKASDEIHKWRQTFDTSSSIQLERILNEMEKNKQSEVTHLCNELRTSLDEFKQATLLRLAELDEFAANINLADADIVVQVIDASQRRRSSTALTRHKLQLIKVFEFNKPRANSTSSTGFFDSLNRFFRRSSTAGASYYNTDFLQKPKISVTKKENHTM